MSRRTPERPGTDRFDKGEADVNVRRSDFLEDAVGHRQTIRPAVCHPLVVDGDVWALKGLASWTLILRRRGGLRLSRSPRGRNGRRGQLRLFVRLRLTQGQMPF